MVLMNSYDGFIFDYGKVLVQEPTDTERTQMAAIAGRPRPEFEESYWKERLDYDKGLLSGSEYWSRVADRILSSEQVNSLTSLDSSSWMHFDEPMWEFVHELQTSGKRVAILSNMPRELGETLKATTRRFDIFDHLTLSYEMKAAKPESSIYKHCVAGIGTPLNKTIFFDDKLANVQGAKMLGLDAIEFLDRDTVLKQMRG